MIIKVTKKRSWGHDRFYSKNELSTGLLKLMNQECFTKDQLTTLKDLGFKIEFFQEEIKL